MMKCVKRQPAFCVILVHLFLSGLSLSMPATFASAAFQQNFFVTKTRTDGSVLFSDTKASDHGLKPTPTVGNPWYSDARIGRDRSDILQSREADWASVSAESSRFVVQTSRGQYYQLVALDGMPKGSIPEPLWWSFSQLKNLLGGDEPLKSAISSSHNEKAGFLAWAGKLEGHDYWVFVPGLNQDEILEAATKNNPNDNIRISGLREYGDSLLSSADAAILATCNGLVEFHRAHPFCSKCGSPTRVTKAGASRKCTSESCGVSVYPRIDVAAIMLITTQCGNYALFGRKQNWPKGRYSTLSGFAEIGETLEQCCVRETWEESGVEVDLSSVEFVCSSPWPFPRSLMAGFQAKAKERGKPTINIDKDEMEDIQWFHKDYVKERLEGGSTAMTFEPNEREKEFHIPGIASLARVLIRRWANGE